ncbi:MAG: hypothetical protein ABJF10_14395, partial [Chthoniobacter sp.]|uniref:hypothetical protein n=1 Tax=Chthoniobacter sp. TaxID=2510640 RepID=UPI0032A7665F
MQLLSLGSMLAGLPDASGSWHFPSVLGSVPPLPVNGAYIGYQIVNLILGILAMWLAAKAVVPKETATFGNVLKAWVCNFALGIGIVVVGVVLLMFAMKMHDAMRSWLMLIGFGGMVLGLVLLIPMKVYSIEAPRAFGLLLLTFCIHFAILFIGLLAVVSFVGRDRVMAVVGQQQFMAMVQSRIAQVQHAQPGQP